MSLIIRSLCNIVILFLSDAAQTGLCQCLAIVYPLGSFVLFNEVATHSITTRRILPFSLVEIGRMEEPKLYECYPAGQVRPRPLIITWLVVGVDVFASRVWVSWGRVVSLGITSLRLQQTPTGGTNHVSFNWNNNVTTPTDSQDQWEVEGRTREKLKELKPERRTYYQVLIDQRDHSQIVIL